MHEYYCELLRVISGDTLEVNIDLGFGVILLRQRVRLYGLCSAPEGSLERRERRVAEFTAAALRHWVSNHAAATLVSREFHREGPDKAIGDVVFYDKAGEHVSWSRLMKDTCLTAPQSWGKSKKELHWRTLYKRLKKYGCIVSKKGNAHVDYFPEMLLWPLPEEAIDFVDDTVHED